MLLFPAQWGEPQESIAVFTPNGTAVQRQPRSIGGWIRRRFFTAHRTALVLLLCLLLSLSSSSLMAQRPRYDKMSPLARLAALNEFRMSRKAQAKAAHGGGGSMLALVQSDSEDVLREHGCRTYAHWGNIYAAAVPKTELAALSLRPEVTRIECGRVSEALTDTAAIITRSANLRVPTAYRSAYTGRGVVVGVMDIGFDLTNPSYYSRDMSTYRVRSFWDMLDFPSDSLSAEGTPWQKDTVYGMELPVGKAYTTTEDILAKACSSDSHLQYHGSHTSTTAAGSPKAMLPMAAAV